MRWRSNWLFAVIGLLFVGGVIAYLQWDDILISLGFAEPTQTRSFVAPSLTFWQVLTGGALDVQAFSAYLGIFSFVIQGFVWMFNLLRRSGGGKG